MIVRIRLQYGPRPRRSSGADRKVAAAFASLLTPSSMMAFALAAWRIGADMRLTSEFAIASGLFSHWQVWMALGALMQGAAVTLNRFARRREPLPEDSLAS